MVNAQLHIGVVTFGTGIQQNNQILWVHYHEYWRKAALPLVTQLQNLQKVRTGKFKSYSCGGQITTALSSVCENKIHVQDELGSSQQFFV